MYVYYSACIGGMIKLIDVISFHRNTWPHSTSFTENWLVGMYLLTTTKFSRYQILIGLARNSEAYVSGMKDKLPLRWMAPETCSEAIFSEHSDV